MAARFHSATIRSSRGAAARRVQALSHAATLAGRDMRLECDPGIVRDMVHAGERQAGDRRDTCPKASPRNSILSYWSSVSLRDGTASHPGAAEIPPGRGGFGTHAGTVAARKAEGMKRSWRSARMMLSACRLVPHIVVLLCSPGGRLVRADLAVWADIMREPAPDRLAGILRTFVLFMTFTKEFRNLFYLRCGIVARLFAPLCPRLAGLEIECPSIGPGLFIQHGENTFVSARRIGANCWIGRHVVIGYSNDTDMPALGDNVRVFAGAKIIGRIDVGDNATVGLNTVVVGNVAPGTTVLGVPGRVIWGSAGRPEPPAPGERL